MRSLFLPLALLVTLAAEAEACDFKFCDPDYQMKLSPRPRAITNEHRQKVGDIYDPGHGRRLQIQNNHRQIIGYIERDGTVTNTHRQRVGTLEW
jgi:hypothetical protein